VHDQTKNSQEEVERKSLKPVGIRFQAWDVATENAMLPIFLLGLWTTRLPLLDDRKDELD